MGGGIAVGAVAGFVVGLFAPPLLAATVIFANLLAIPVFFAVVPTVVRLAALKRDLVAPLAISASMPATTFCRTRMPDSSIGP